MVRKVFISHDGNEVELADELRDSLETLCADIECFVARGRRGGNGRLPHGKEWRAALKRELDTCHAFVVILTERSSTRPWVNYEIGAADERKISVFPLVLQPDQIDIRSHPTEAFQYAVPDEKEVAMFFANILTELKCDVPWQKRLENEAKRYLTAVMAFWQPRPSMADSEAYHLSFVRSQLGNGSRDAIFELDTAIRTKEIPFIKQFLVIAKTLHAGDWLRTVCGDKDWDKIGKIYEYMNENVNAAKRGVRVHRIYIEPEKQRYPKGFHDCEWSVIDCHLQWAKILPDTFKVSVLVEQAAEDALRDFCLPTGFGMVIPHGDRPEVLVHYGMSNKDRRARAFEQPATVAVYESIHEALAERISPEDLVMRRLNQANPKRHVKLEYPTKSQPKEAAHFSLEKQSLSE